MALVALLALPFFLVGIPVALAIVSWVFAVPAVVIAVLDTLPVALEGRTDQVRSPKSVMLAAVLGTVAVICTLFATLALLVQAVWMSSAGVLAAGALLLAYLYPSPDLYALAVFAWFVATSFVAADLTGTHWWSIALWAVGGVLTIVVGERYDCMPPQETSRRRVKLQKLREKTIWDGRVRHAARMDDGRYERMMNSDVLPGWLPPSFGFTLSLAGENVGENGHREAPTA